MEIADVPDCIAHAKKLCGTAELSDSWMIGLCGFVSVLKYNILKGVCM